MISYYYFKRLLERLLVLRTERTDVFIRRAEQREAAEDAG